MKFKSFMHKVMSNWPVKIISLVAAVIIYFFNYYNNLGTYRIDVPLTVNIPVDEFALSSAHVPAVSFTVKGSTDLELSKLTKDDFEAYANLTNGKIKVNEQIRVNIQYQKKGKALTMEPLSVSIVPEYITVTVEKRMEKGVEIIPDLKLEELAGGYDLTGSILNPDKLMISGPESKVKAIDKVTTEPISFANRKKDFSLFVKIIIPEYITTRNIEFVEFTAAITEVMTEMDFNDIPIIGVNIDEALMIGNTLPTGSMKIKSPNGVIGETGRDVLRLIINCENIKQQGKYTLRTTPGELPEAVIILDYTPKEVFIDLIPGR